MSATVAVITVSAGHYAHRAVNKPAVNVVNHNVHIGKPMAAVGKTTIAGARRTGTINSVPVNTRNTRGSANIGSVSHSNSRSVSAATGTRTGTSAHGNFGGRR